MGATELLPVRKSRGHGDFDPSHATPDEGADLEDLEADRGAARFGKLRMCEADPAQSADKDIGH